MRAPASLIIATMILASISPEAIAEDPAAEGMLPPEPIKRMPKVYVTADELANPDLYYPRYENLDYTPPPIVALPPPPANQVVRPGEFEPLDSTIITIVAFDSDYYNMWVDMLSAYSKGGHTYIIVENLVEDYMRTRLEQADVATSDYTMLTENDGYPVNTIWVRDYGPEFVREADGTRHIFDADYSHRPLDDVIPLTMGADDWINGDGSPMEVHSVDHYLSGGNIFSDGAGTCFFSNIVYGDEKPSGWTDQEVDDLMRDYLGCEQMIVLNPICLDGTGHIDLYAKGMGRHSILLGQFQADTHFDGTTASGVSGGHCSDYDMPNDYQDQEDNLAILEASTNLDGEPWEITRVPILEPYYEYGYWVYRSYMNSEIFNGVVAMPSYYDPKTGETEDYLLDKEAEAIAAYEAAAPNGVDVYPIDADHIIGMAGAIHCISHDIPAETDYEYSEPGDEDDADEDAGGPDSGTDDGGGGGGDDGCGCATVSGHTISTSWIGLLF